MAYSRTTWQNLPSTNTPINATNLNKIENELSITDGSSTNEITFTCTDTDFNTHNLVFYKLADKLYYLTGTINKRSGGNNPAAGNTITIGNFNKNLTSITALTIGSSNNTLDGNVNVWQSGEMVLQIPSSGREFSGSYFIISGIIRTTT